MDLNEQKQANNEINKRKPQAASPLGSKGNVQGEQGIDKNKRSGLQPRAKSPAMRREELLRRKANPALVGDKLHGKYATRHLTKQAKKNLNQAMDRMKTGKHTRKKEKKEAWQLEKEKGAKVYKLTAYTTTDSINKKFRREKRQRVLRKILVTLLIIVILLMIVGKFLDFSKLKDLNLKDFGKMELE